MKISMRTLMILLAICISMTIFLTLANSSEAAEVSLKWDANTEPDLAGYKLYSGTQSREYEAPVNVGNVTQFTVTGLLEKETYYFAVTAFDTEDRESDYSNEVSTTIPNCPPGAPCSVTINIPASCGVTVNVQP